VPEIVPYRPNPLGGSPRETQGPPAGYPDSYPEPPADSAGLREYLAIVRRQIWLVLAVLLLAVGASIYNVMKAPARYRAISTVRLTDPTRSMTGSMNTMPYQGSIGRETDLLQSQIQILTSQTVAAAAVDMNGLRLVPTPGHRFVDEVTEIRVADSAPLDSIRVSFGPTSVTATGTHAQVNAAYGQPLEIQGVSFKVTQRPAVASSTFSVVPKTAAIGHALGGFQASPRPKTDIIDLSYIGNEPYEARRVTNAMAMAFQAHNASTSQKQSRRRRIFLEGQLRQTDSMLRDATAAFSSFRSREQVFSSKDKATAQEQGLVDIDMKRSELDAERRTYQSLLSQAQRSGQGSEASLRVLVSSPGIAANPVIQQLYTQLTSYEEVLDSLETAGAAPTNPDVIAIKSRISSTSNKLIGAVRSQVQSLDARIAAMDNLRSTSSSQIAAAPAAQTQEGQLEQQVQNVQKMADALQSELQLAKMAEAVEAGQVEIIDLAAFPGSPISSGSPRKVALGIIIGLLLGVGLAVVVDGMNTSIRRRTDIERMLQIPGLAVIPRLVQGRNADRKITRALPRRSGNGKAARASTPDLVTLADVRSASAEAYRTLRTNLIFSQSVRSLRTIVVTSASPGEGKTTTAANLAVSFAQYGMRVLLVDCDLRRSRLHKVFDIGREPGITEMVLGREEPEAVTRETNTTGLYVIPSGVLPPNPSELLGGERMRKCLTALSEAFDLIILDTPPLLAASDGAILATLSDGVVLVLRAGATESEAAQQAIQQLSAVGARIVGAVLNDPDAKVPLYSGYYHYEYAGANN
jgi:succinoglycan biosynthesis transport protein ExoP